ncbi:hypothetical protein [Dyadobacter sandarakinus]|uniref:Right handed beta helix region n=1 Tax=Dyadobacter sandarakinus TaxID=2747268 RepID=A0ABX7I129_9BACT|nr:hypothetical protein [Dyadobacter sandarakinus]QRQ99723.1 hypothetical protein HWI92_01725 [Dyadobacter sandarakinus]
MDNQPIRLDKVFTAFKLNPFDVQIDLEEGFSVSGPVTLELFYDGVAQPDVVVPVTVSGDQISFTFTPEQLQAMPTKGAQFFIKYGGEYHFEAPIVTTLNGALPTSRAISVTTPLSQVIRVSAYNDLGLSASAAVQNTYLKDLASATLEDVDQEWEEVTSTTAGTSANSATVNPTTKVISLTASATGVGANLRQTFNLTNFTDLKKGDVITIMGQWKESITNAINTERFKMTLIANGSAVSVFPRVKQLTPTVLQYEADYTVQTISDSLEVRFTIGAGNTAFGSTNTYTWVFLGIGYDKQKFDQFSRLNADAVKKTLNSLYPFYERSPKISKASGNGTIDDSAIIQDEINDAIQTSGKYEFRRGQVSKVLSPLSIKGGLHIYGYNRSGARINGDTAGMNVFEIDTTSSVWFSHFEIGRSANVTATAIKFLSNVINRRSLIEDMRFTSVKGLEVFSSDGLEVWKSEFQGPQNPVTIDTSAGVGTVSNALFNWNKFIDCDKNAFDIYSASNLTIANNECRSTGTTYIDNFARLSLKYVATNKGLFLFGNNVSGIQNNGLVVSTDADVFLKRLEAYDNTFECQAAASSANCISLTATTSNGIEDVSVESNKLYNKLYGVTGTNIKNFIFGGGRVIGDGTAGSRALNLTNASYSVYSFLRSGQSTADVLTGTAL